MSIQTMSGYGNTPAAPVSPQGSPAPAAGVSEAKTKPEPQPQSTQPSMKQVQEAVKEMARVIQPKANNLQFSIDNETGKTVVRITDSQTGEVIRQMPSKELLEIAKSIDKLQGLLVRQKA